MPIPYEGKRVLTVDGPDVYLIIPFNGQWSARWIPTQQCYDRLFDDGAITRGLPAITPDGTAISTVPPIPLGDDFGPASCIVKYPNAAPLYLFDGSRLSHIPTVATWNFYGFTHNNAKFVDPNNDGGLGIDWGAVIQAGISVLPDLI